MRDMRLVLLLVPAFLAASPARADPRPLGVFEQTLGRFDRDTLQPVGPALELGEAHTGPVLEHGARRFAIGVSSPGLEGVPETGAGRVGLWVVDAAVITVQRQIRTGIAAEAVVFPGKVAAVLQDGALVVVDPDDGRILSRRDVGYSDSIPHGVEAGGRGVLVNEIHRGRSVEVAVVAASGRVRTATIPLPGVGRKVGLTSDGRRAYIAGNHRIAVLDPATLHVTTRRFDGSASSAAFADGRLALAGPGGLRLYDAGSWRPLARDRTSDTVFAAGRAIIAGGAGHVSARTLAGRRLWRASGNVQAVAAGRVYTRREILDAKTGARVGTHPENYTSISLIG